MAISKVVYKSSANATPEVWMDATTATAAAADITAPKTAMLANGVVTTGTGSGGGASSLLTGTFQYGDTEAGTAQDITLPYTGNGYPTAVEIYLTDGFNSSNSYYSMVSRYAMQTVAIAKCNTTAPTYTGSAANNQGTIIFRYKNDNEYAYSYTTNFIDAHSTYYNTAASSNVDAFIRIKNATTISVRVKSSQSDYGFARNVSYTYVVNYSE